MRSNCVTHHITFLINSMYFLTIFISVISISWNIESIQTEEGRYLLFFFFIIFCLFLHFWNIIFLLTKQSYDYWMFTHSKKTFLFKLNVGKKYRIFQCRKNHSNVNGRRISRLWNVIKISTLIISSFIFSYFFLTTVKKGGKFRERKARTEKN